ncbi:MAG TPA: hypothetical protein VFW13_11140 [Phenylobacterium sp.]|nr:hypothetical protein [Phenylobacterium sp.]
MRFANWTALGIAAGMSSCSIMVATPAAQLSAPVTVTAAAERIAPPAAAHVLSQAPASRAVAD